MAEIEAFGVAKLMHDHPIALGHDDKFSMRHHASLVCAAITKIDTLPITVGVFGAWGTGKTSFLRLIGEHLGADTAATKPKIVWFNAWKYQTEGQVWSGLLQAIIRQIENDSTAGPVKERARKLGKGLLRFAFGKAADLLTSGLVSTEDVDDLLDRVCASDEKAWSQENSFGSEFDELVEKYTGGGKLIVLIDDLDRCLPDTSLQIFEALKLFLDNAKCVFVVALDIEQFYRSLAMSDGRLRLVSREYIEKLIQVPIYLPSPSDLQLREFVQDRSGLILSDHVWAVVREVCLSNPRRAQRFANALLLAVTSLGTESARAIDVARLLAFRLLWPEFFERLCADPGLWYELDQRVLTEPAGQAQSDEPGLLDLIGRTGSASAALFPPPPAAEETKMLLRAVSVFGNSAAALDRGTR